ncbi:MAG: hypothetical protein NTZ93_03180 [Candidatus Beckwithbacteria bacterium]|nr:hypothetical protein [Candidatus Beckwithbacteria bacterium]
MKLKVGYYNEEYNLKEFYELKKKNFWIVIVVLLLTFLIVTFKLLPNNFTAVLISFVAVGVISDLLINMIVGNIWSRKSLRDVDGVQKYLSPLEQVSWLPRIIGIFERIIFTASFIMQKPEFIGIWLGLKVIGSWKDNSPENLEKERKKKEKGEKVIKLWRIRENIFLIGTALSLFSSFFASYIYSQIIHLTNSFDNKSIHLQKKIMYLQHNYYHFPAYDNFSKSEK